MAMGYAFNEVDSKITDSGYAYTVTSSWKEQQMGSTYKAWEREGELEAAQS